MFDYYDIYWWGNIWQVLVMIALLINIWHKKNCSGISLKSQTLYALVFATRQRDLDIYRIPLENWIVKTAFMIVTCGTVLTIFKSKTYEKSYDTFRSGIAIIPCMALSLIASSRFDYWYILMAFSFYLEAVAMVPQFQFTIKVGRIEKNVFLYIAAMALYSFLQVVYFSNKNWGYEKAFRLVAATIQFLLYCNFFHQIYPTLCPQNNDDDQSTKSYLDVFHNVHSFLRTEKAKDDVEAIIENETPNRGHLASNVSNIVLTPSSLIGVHKNKGIPEANKGSLKQSGIDYK